VLALYPQIGKPSEVLDPEYRELPIGFGDGGYIALYHYDGQIVVIVAVRHQRESGFSI
jgi:plasmid stabilization system protein ParE